MRKKALSLALALSLMAAALSGCSGNASEMTTKNETAGSAQPLQEELTGETKTGEDSVVVYATPTAPVGTFNPLLSYMGSDNAINDIAFASLLQLGPDGTLEPYLAEGYDISEDQKVITFHLKTDVKWQDGRPFTAEDVKFTLETMAHKDLVGGSDYGKVQRIAGAEAFHNGEADGIAGIKILDDYTIELNFDETYAPVLMQIGRYGMIAKHVWESIPLDSWEKQTEMLNYPIGCGPYKVTNYVSGQYVEMEAFEDFFGGAPKIQKFIFKVVNQDAISAELASGAIDIAGVKELQKSEVDQLEAQGFKRYVYADDMYQYISFNLRMPIFQDKNLRQAVVYAIDRPLIVEAILEGRGSLIDSPFLPNSWASPQEADLNSYSYNPEKSIELLEASGWADGDGDGIRENDQGEKLQFTLRCSNDSKARERAVLFVKECLFKVGIDVEVSIEEDSVIADDCIFNHNFEMYALNCYFGEDPDLYFWWHSNSASDEPGVGSFNFGSYKNDKVDQDIQDALSTMNQSDRKAHYLNAAKQINEDVPMVFLYVQNREILCNPSLTGFEPSTFHTFYNIHNWQLTK